jgi:hypothetical protein
VTLADCMMSTVNEQPCAVSQACGVRVGRHQFSEAMVSHVRSQSYLHGVIFVHAHFTYDKCF